jgi:hypothetical protein
MGILYRAHRIVKTAACYMVQVQTPYSQKSESKLLTYNKISTVSGVTEISLGGSGMVQGLT